MKPHALIVLTVVFVLSLLLWGSSCTQLTVPPENGEPDTTSHNFSFETFVLGDGNDSALYDIAIINDTLAYAVGEISVKDSTGQFINPPYNVARWDGKDWQLLTVFYEYQGQQFFSPIQSVFAFHANDIWFGIGNLIHWDGKQYTSVQLPSPVWGPYRINEMWGTNSELYIVGDGGSIARYVGGGWQKIESETTTNIRDIWGNASNHQPSKPIIAVASSSGEARILSLVNQSIIESRPWPVGLGGIWISPTSIAYLSGAGGVWRQEDSSWQLMEGLPDSIFYGAIRGNSDYDIFLDAGRLMHFNGKNWHAYLEIPSEVHIQSIAVKQNTMVAVGFTVRDGFFVDKAAVIIGKRR